jgi:hypothetical protein
MTARSRMSVAGEPDAAADGLKIADGSKDRNDTEDCVMSMLRCG